MLIKTIEIHDAQADLKKLLSLVAEGAEIVLTDGATPLARLVPVTPSAAQRVTGLHSGAIWTSEDFDDPLPDAFWANAT